MSKYFSVKQFAAGSCYSYILNSQNEALVVDPHISLQEEYLGYLKKKRLKLKYIIDTHTHADHFSLAASLKKQLNVPVLMHERAISEVANKKLKEGDIISLGVIELKVIYAPGHTDDTMAIYGEGKVFTGDVLLIGSVGRTDFQNGSPEFMFDTLQKLKALPEETIMFPAHDYNGKIHSTIAKEKANNPFLKEENKDRFISNSRSKQLPKPFNIDNIIRVNRKGEAAVLKMISVKQAQASKDFKVKFLDVRSASEFNEVHIKDSINIPIDMLVSKVKELSQSGQGYIVLCHSGNRSPMAADMLLQSGIHSVKVMQGGMTAWQKERLPVIKGDTSISLERQVRIAAGTLMLAGIIAAHFLNSAFIWISVWVACGLIFAGLTNSCLMGMLLMRLPFNKKIFKSKTGGGTCSISQ